MTISAPVLEKMYRIYEKTEKSSKLLVKMPENLKMSILPWVLGEIYHF